jgi:hypothetical protein
VVERKGERWTTFLLLYRLETADCESFWAQFPQKIFAELVHYCNIRTVSFNSQLMVPSFLRSPSEWTGPAGHTSSCHEWINLDPIDTLVSRTPAPSIETRGLIGGMEGPTFDYCHVASLVGGAMHRHPEPPEL